MGQLSLTLRVWKYVLFFVLYVILLSIFLFCSFYLKWRLIILKNLVILNCRLSLYFCACLCMYAYLFIIRNIKIIILVTYNKVCGMMRRIWSARLIICSFICLLPLISITLLSYGLSLFLLNYVVKVNETTPLASTMKLYSFHILCIMYFWHYVFFRNWSLDKQLVV